MSYDKDSILNSLINNSFNYDLNKFLFESLFKINSKEMSNVTIKNLLIHSLEFQFLIEFLFDKLLTYNGDFNGKVGSDVLLPALKHNKTLFKKILKNNFNLFDLKHELLLIIIDELNDNDINEKIFNHYFSMNHSTNKSIINHLLVNSIKNQNYELLEKILTTCQSDKLEVNTLINDSSFETIKKLLEYPFIFNQKDILNQICRASIKQNNEDILNYVLKNYKFSSSSKNNALFYCLVSGYKSLILILLKENDLDINNFIIEYCDFFRNNLISDNLIFIQNKNVNTSLLLSFFIKKSTDFSLVIKELLNDNRSIYSCELFRHCKNVEVKNILLEHFGLREPVKFFKIQFEIQNEIIRRIKLKERYIDIYGTTRVPKIGEKLALFKHTFVGNTYKRRVVEVINNQEVIDVLDNTKYYLEQQDIISFDNPNFCEKLIKYLELEIDEKLPMELDSDIKNINDKILFAQDYFVRFNNQIVKINENVFKENCYFDCMIGDYIRELIEKFEEVKTIIQDYLLLLEKQKYQQTKIENENEKENLIEKEKDQTKLIENDIEFNII